MVLTYFTIQYTVNRPGSDHKYMKLKKQSRVISSVTLIGLLQVPLDLVGSENCQKNIPPWHEFCLSDVKSFHYCE